MPPPDLATERSVGVLHPGAMGAAVGAALVGGRHEACWVSDGRGAPTRRRADAARLTDCVDLGALADRCQVILSVCPPHAAVNVAELVAARGFDGLYCDANAVSPATCRRVANVVEAGGARFVDGGIVGGPPWQSGTTRLYLSGAGAGEIAALFSASPLETIVLDGPPGVASALKVSYAAWTKGTSALLLAIRAFARAENVDDALLDEWERSQPGVGDRSALAVFAARSAWRFEGEMREIADSFGVHGLPRGFHEAAAAMYEKMTDFKDTDAPQLDAVLRALGRPEE